MDKEKKVPELRFKNFTGVWIKQQLNDICLINPSTSKLPEYFNYIDLESVVSGKLTKKNNLTDKKNAPSRAKRLLKNNDILYQTVRPYQKNNYFFVENEKFATVASTGYAQLRCKKNNDPKFLYQAIHTDKFVNNVLPRCTGTSYPAINSNDLSTIRLWLPSLQEQHKIGNFLSLLDAIISNQQEQVEVLENIKKGYMQKIFSQEIRFKDDYGNCFPEWEPVELRNILKEVNDKTIKLNQYEVLSSTTTGLFLQSEYFNRDIASTNNIGYKILKKGQIVFSPQNLWMGNINLNTKYEVGMVSPSYKVYDISSKFSSEFIGYLIKTPRAMYEFMISSEQGASIVRRNLNMDLFKQIRFDIPCLKEQIKIAGFLSTLDKKIDLEKEVLEHWQQIKKGLLQKMFV